MSGNSITPISSTSASATISIPVSPEAALTANTTIIIPYHPAATVTTITPHYTNSSSTSSHMVGITGVPVGSIDPVSTTIVNTTVNTTMTTTIPVTNASSSMPHTLTIVPITNASSTHEHTLSVIPIGTLGPTSNASTASPHSLSVIPMGTLGPTSATPHSLSVIPITSSSANLPHVPGTSPHYTNSSISSTGVPTITVSNPENITTVITLVIPLGSSASSFTA